MDLRHKPGQAQSIQNPQAQKTSTTTSSNSTLSALFVCPCSKQYKSYPALYTHIKCKHFQYSGQYMEKAIRPKKANINRGRPRKQYTSKSSSEDNQMNVLECGLIELCDELKKAKMEKGVLVGEEQSCLEQIEGEYSKIAGVYGSPSSSIYQNEDEQKKKLKQFYQQFRKHLSNGISARLLYTLNDWVSMPNNDDQCLSVIESWKKGKITRIWFNSDQVQKIILKVYQQWRQI